MVQLLKYLRFHITLLAMIAVFTPTTSAAPPCTVTVYDFVDHSDQATISQDLEVRFSYTACKGIAQSAILLPATSDPNVSLEIHYADIHLPALQDGLLTVELRYATGIHDGIDLSTLAETEGYAFMVKLNNEVKQVHVQDEQTWHEHVIDLSPYAGQTVDISWLVDARDFALVGGASWGHPQVVVTGEGPFIESLAAKSGMMLPTTWPIEKLKQRTPPAKRLVHLAEDDRSVTAIAVLDERLDLSTQLQRQAHTYGDPCVPLSPRLVAGQGSHKQNHTVVRILNAYGIAETQFLAYPPHVRGGVQVEAGRNPEGLLRIVCAPLADRTQLTLRVFNENGTLMRQWIPRHTDLVLRPPYRIAVGNIDTGHDGDEVAVVSHDQAQSIGIFTMAGQFLAAITFSNHPVNLSAFTTRNQGQRDRLLCLDVSGEELWDITPMSQSISHMSLDPHLALHGVYGSAYHPDRLVGSGPDSLRSRLWIFSSSDPNGTWQDVGHRENTFWMAWRDTFEKTLGDVPNKNTLNYLRFCRYGHLRLESASPLRLDPQRKLDPVKHEQLLVEALTQRNLLRPLPEQELRMWEPCFTHRQISGLFDR
ncbi:hypothetical protein ACFL6U_32860, partial [Planctomycetota bacterium]